MGREAKKGSRTSRFLIAVQESDKWDSCVKDVKKKGLVGSPYAVCTAAVGAPAKKKEAVDSQTKVAATPAIDQQVEDIQTLIVQNPTMNAASFYNLLRAKGFEIKKEAQVSNPALNRAKESAIKESGAPCQFMEGGGGGMNGEDRYQNRFRRCLP